MRARGIQVCLLLMLAVVVCAESTVERTITLDLSRTQKDLASSQLGASVQMFRSHYSLQQMFDQGAVFDAFISNIGAPVWRMHEQSSFGWWSKDEYLKLRDAYSRFYYLAMSKTSGAPQWSQYSPDDYYDLVKKYSIKTAPVPMVVKRNHPDISWFPPEVLHAFCRRNGIRLIGSFRDIQYLDPDTGKVVWFRDRPEYFDGAVKDNMRKLEWVLKNGYQDLYVGWEIGNEAYASWDPVLFAQYAGKIIEAATRLQPSIRLTVPLEVTDTNDPLVAQLVANKGDRYSWHIWHEKMFPALGEAAKKVYYATIHVYGAAAKYSANIKGIDSARKILEKHPNAKHMRFLLTEWRHTGPDDTLHRTFRVAALWKAKFSLMALSHPYIDYTGVHEFLTVSGLGYWTPGAGNAGEYAGDEWVFQSPAGKTGEPWIKSRTGKPQFDIGPYGPVCRMINELVRECPLLIEHKADQGDMSSAVYVENSRTSDPPADKGDLDWFICATKDRAVIGGVIVNTLPYPVSVSIAAGRSITMERSSALTCDNDKLRVAEDPGEEKFCEFRRSR